MHPGADTRLRVLAGEPDERLVALVRAGDERAFDEIVTRYRGPLLRYVRRYLPPAAAEDALQQAFINAYAALTSETAKVPAALRPWIYRVAHNAALNVGRDPQAAFVPLPDGLDGVERPEEALQRSERLWSVVRALRALPERQRQVIVRHALDGDSHEQIAADLGVSAGAVRQMAHRARRTVREAATAWIPLGILRWLPWGSALTESSAAGGGATGAKLAATVAVTALAGGGAVEVARHDRARTVRDVAARIAPEQARAAGPARDAPPPVQAVARLAAAGGREGSSPGSGRGGLGSSGSGGSGSSGSGSGGSDNRGSGGDGSDTSGSNDSRNGSSGRGSNDSGSGTSGSGSGTSNSGSTGDTGSGTSGSGSGTAVSGSGSNGSGSGTSGSGSGSAYDSSGSGSGSPGNVSTTLAAPEPTSSGSGSSGSGGSGPG